MATYDLSPTTGFVGANEAAAQGMVEAMTGIVLPRRLAKVVLERIPDHKWLLSEQLGRDVGLRVAAVDLIENFYEPVPKKRLGILTGKIWNEVKSAFVRYVEAKGNAMPM
ncbi:MAG TPA: hypothetical protein VFZ49_11075 [Pyrinomonadaceae bacterium]